MIDVHQTPFRQPNSNLVRQKFQIVLAVDLFTNTHLSRVALPCGVPPASRRPLCRRRCSCSCRPTQDLTLRCQRRLSLQGLLLKTVDGPTMLADWEVSNYKICLTNIFNCTYCNYHSSKTFWFNVICCLQSTVLCRERPCSARDEKYVLRAPSQNDTHIGRYGSDVLELSSTVVTLRSSFMFLKVRLGTLTLK